MGTASLPANAYVQHARSFGLAEEDEELEEDASEEDESEEDDAGGGELVEAEPPHSGTFLHDGFKYSSHQSPG